MATGLHLLALALTRSFSEGMTYAPFALFIPVGRVYLLEGWIMAPYEHATVYPLDSPLQLGGWGQAAADKL